MYNAEIVFELMIEMTNVMGLKDAWKYRLALVYPQLQVVNAKKFGGVGSREKLKTDFSGLEKKARTLRRTLKGFVQVVDKFAGPAKGLEAIGLDRVKQATEEVRRLKADYTSLIEEFDEKVRNTSQQLQLGRP